MFASAGLKSLPQDFVAAASTLLKMTMALWVGSKVMLADACLLACVVSVCALSRQG